MPGTVMDWGVVAGRVLLSECSQNDAAISRLLGFVLYLARNSTNPKYQCDNVEKRLLDTYM